MTTEQLKLAFDLEEFAKRGASYEANKTMRAAAAFLRSLPSPGALDPSDAQEARTSPITEGYVVKGGQNQGESQIKIRPPAPGAINRREQ